LCDHKSLLPFGGCRLCIVEVEGMRTLQPSCSLPVSNNMVVKTNTDKVLAARKFVLTLIFSDRNHFCPYCQVSGGDCELQNSALDMGMTHWDYQPNWKPYPVDASHPYLVIDHNRCILCRRCVRACGELVGNFCLGIEERGANSMLVCDTGVPFGESSCISCGTCSQICPTGAIIDRHSAYQGLDKKVDRTNSICVACSMGCGIDVHTRDNRLVRILGDWDAPINGGVLCKLGRFLPLEDKRERVTTPMLKKDGKLQPVTWDEAIKAVADHVKPSLGMNGSGVAAAISPRLPVETLTAFKKLFKDGAGSDMVTTLDEGQLNTAAETLAGEMGPFEASLETLKYADCVVTLGVDLSEDHQVAGFMVKRILPTNTALVVVGSADNGFAPFARSVLKVAPGSEKDALNGLSAAVTQLGLVKDGSSSDANLTTAAQKTGIPAGDFVFVAGLVANATHPVFVYGKDLDLAALKALVAFAGQIGAKDSLLGLKGAANSLAVAQLHLDTTFKRNGHKVVYLAVGDDTPSQRFIQQVEGAPFLVVQASYASRLTAMADVVLPVEMWAEQEGHYLNMEGRLQAAHASLVPPDGVRSNLAVLKNIAEWLGLDITASWKDEITARQSPVQIVAG
jgi:formate dehydrogenase major subunit